MTERKIPKSLKECYEQDSVTRSLCQWSERLKSWGSKVLVVLIIIGIISTISEVIEAMQIDGSLAIFVAVASAITWGLYAFIEYCVYNVLALFIRALASIVYNSQITANVSLYNLARTEQGAVVEDKKLHDEKTKNKSAIQHAWICNKCGQMRGESPCPHCGGI